MSALPPALATTAASPAPTPIVPTRPKPKDNIMPPAPKPTPAPILNLTIPRSALLPALRSAKEVSDERGPFPANAAIHLVAGDGYLHLRATNGYQALSIILAASVRAPGSLLLSASDFLARVEALPDGTVSVAERVTTVEMKCGAGRCTIATFPRSEVPTVPTPEPEGHDVDAASLSALLCRLAPTMHEAPLEVGMHAIYLAGDGSRLVGQSFNGYAAAEASLTFDGALDALVPGPAVKQLEHILDGIDGTVRLAVVDRRLCVWGPLGMVYTTILSAGSFPPVDSLWRTPEGPFLRVDREAMREAVQAIRAGLHHDRVRIRPTAAGVTVHGLTQEGAEASREVSAACSLESVSVTRQHLVRLLDFFGEEETVTLWSAAGERRVGGAPGPIFAVSEGARYMANTVLFDALDLAATDGATEEEAA